MNKLVMVVAAAMTFAAFAQEPADSAEGSKARPMRPDRAAMRSMRPPMMMGQGAFDPLMRAVMNPQVAEKIGLSEDQKTKIAALKGENRANRDLQAKVKAGMDRQVELLKAEKIDEAAVMKTIDEVFEARKEMAKAQTKRMIQVRSILTPEQVTKALEAIKEFRGQHRARNGAKERGPKGDAPKRESSPAK